jgi:hypothetical protein
MTYFLMFQLGFMVIGWLYSLWRILLALVVILLYSVAALDSSLLHTAQASARADLRAAVALSACHLLNLSLPFCL